jgi:hypothetical protein
VLADASERDQVRTVVVMRLRILAVSFASLLVLAGCGGSNDSDSSDDGSGTTIETSVSTTAGDVVETTEAATEATTSTTEEATTTTTSTTEEPTTTTIAPGPTGLSLSGDGLGLLRFGTDADVAVEFLGGIFGPPASDSGWIDSFSGFGTCPGTEVRGVTYGPLTVLFGGPDNDRTFFSWNYFDQGNGDVFGLTSPAGVGLGSSADEVAAAYADVEFFEDEVFGETATFGTLFASLEEGVVTYLSGGIGCGE